MRDHVHEWTDELHTCSCEKRGWDAGYASGLKDMRDSIRHVDSPPPPRLSDVMGRFYGWVMAAVVVWTLLWLVGKVLGWVIENMVIFQ